MAAAGVPRDVVRGRPATFMMGRAQAVLVGKFAGHGELSGGRSVRRAMWKAWGERPLSESGSEGPRSFVMGPGLLREGEKPERTGGSYSVASDPGYVRGVMARLRA